MCAFLMDTGRTGAAVRLRKRYFFRLSLVTSALQGHTVCAFVLATLISLALAHEDALLILSESPFFIPSLVKLLANLSTALWEDDSELTVSDSLLSEFVSPSLSPPDIF